MWGVAKSIALRRSRARRPLLCRGLALAAAGFFVAIGEAAVLDLPDSTITGLTHTFGHFAPSGVTTLIEDKAAAGQYSQTGFTAALTGSETVVMRFAAPVGMKFVVHAPPAGFESVLLTVRAEWSAGSDAGISPISSSATFENLVGPAPSRSSSDLLGASGNWVRIFESFTVAPGMEFTAVDISVRYGFAIATPTDRSFAPVSFSFGARASSSQSLGDGTLFTLEAVPEPGSLTVLLPSLAALAWARRRTPLRR